MFDDTEVVVSKCYLAGLITITIIFEVFVIFKRVLSLIVP